MNGGGKRAVFGVVLDFAANLFQRFKCVLAIKCVEQLLCYIDVAPPSDEVLKCAGRRVARAERTDRLYPDISPELGVGHAAVVRFQRAGENAMDEIQT